MPSFGRSAGPTADPWLIRSSMGLDLGLGSAFNNRLSPSKNKTIEFRPSSFANELELDGIVPRYYGKNLKVFPKHAAQPYTINYGNDIRLHCVFILGYGPLNISDIRIGSKKISEFGSDIEYEIRRGLPGDSPLTLFTQDVNETAINNQIPFGSTVEAQAGYCNHILVDLFFPRGLYQIVTRTTASGGQVQVPAQLWRGIYVNVTRKDTGASVYSASTIFNENIQGPFYRTIAIPNLSATEYKVTVQRAQAIGDQSTIIDDVQCLSIKGVKYGHPIIPYKDAAGSNIGIAYIAVRAKGSAKTQGAMDALNCKVTSLLKTYSGGVWTEVVSQAPADVVADLLCGTVNPRPIPRARLNGPAFAQWKTQTESLGYYWNEGFEKSGELLEDAIEAVAFAGRGLYVPRDASGLHSARFETENPVIDNLVGPWNSRGLKMQKVNGDIPHAIKAIWISAENDFVQEETIVPRPGYTKDTATTFEAMTFRGVNNHPQVYKLALYHWAAALYRGTTYEFEMNNEYRLLGVGSRIKYTNDAINYGVGDGLVKSVILDASGNCTGIVINEPLDMVSTKEYAVRIRCNDGTLHYKQLNSGNGSFTTLTFRLPIPSGSVMPAARDLVQISYFNVEADLIVAEITPGEDLTATIQCLDYAEVIYSAANGTIPSYTPPVTIPERSPVYIPPKPVITGILSDENVMLQYGTTLIPRIKVSYTVPGSNRVQYVKYTYKREDETEFPPPTVLSGQSGEFYLNNVREGVNYNIQLIAVADNNFNSEPLEVSHVVIGRLTPPPDVVSMYPQGEVMQLVLPPLPVDFAHIQVRVNFGRSNNWDQAITLIDKLVSASFPLDLLPQGVITVLAKIYDVAGNASINARTITHDFGETVTQNVFLQDDAQPSWSTTTITNGTVSGGEVFADSSGGKFYTGSGAKVYSHVAGAKIYSGGWKTLTVERHYEPRSDITDPWILKLDYAVDAENYHVYIKSPGSGKFYSGNTSARFYSGVAGAKIYDKNGDEYRLWNGERLGQRRRYSIKIECLASAIKQSKISRFGIIADMPDIEEDFNNQVIGPAGNNISLQKIYRQITSIVPVLQSDAAYPTAASVQIVSALPYNTVIGTDGPVVKVFDTALVATSGKVAGKVKGW